MAKRQAAEASDAAKPKTVKVEALEWHTYNGNAYDVGDTYDIDEQLVDSVTYQGKAVRVDRAAVARKAAAPAKAGKRGRNTAVSPMSTAGVDVKPRARRKAR